MNEPTDDTFNSTAGVEAGRQPSAEDGVAAGEQGDQECKERLHRIVRVFHNDVGSPLAAIGLRLEMLRGRLRPNQVADAELNELSLELDKVVDTVRRALKELREVEAAAARPH